MEIRSLATTSFEALFEAFSRAFADYELQLDGQQLRAMLKRRGFDPALSFAAFDGGRIVSFTCNGIGDFNGIPTAYDTGTGTLEDYRGKGLATRIFEHSIPYLKDAGIGQYLLEVLQHNAKAVSVYRNIGFAATREFNYFGQENGEIRSEVKVSARDFEVKRIDIAAHPSISGFWDFHPSWQNSFESIVRSKEGFVCSGAFDGERLAGYCVFEPASGDITQIAVDKAYRRRGIASLLLREMIGLNRCGAVKLLNADTSCVSITEFMKACNIALRGQQFEMAKEI